MLIRPIITEKTMKATGLSRFAFEVGIKMTKTEIKQTVSKTFGVNVIKVQTSTVPGKAYRTGKRFKYAYKPDWKKAVVTLKPGQKIELFDVRETETEVKK